MGNKGLIDRRTCLRGAGATLALPLLDTMGWAERRTAGAVKPPVRLGFMYMPHGVIMEQFWPADPKSYKASPPRILESLRPVLDECLLMKGIRGVPISPLNGAPHALELSTWLTATLPDVNRRNIVNIAISADQIAANSIGAFTPMPSLELATMPQTHKENQEGLNEAYYSHCSFRSPTQPLPAETDPRRVLKRLFRIREGGPAAGAPVQADALDRSMLDLVLKGSKDLRRRLGPGDRHKLDEYMDGVRALERRIAALELRRLEAAKAASGKTPGRKGSKDSPTIQVTIPEGEKRSAYMQVMCDLTVLAFQTDTTRVSTYIGSTPNGVSYPELGFTDQHHSQTHHNHRPKMVEKVAAINAFNVAQFAYMVKRLHALREGDGTLLDNCIMMWGSGLEDGNKHRRDNLPFVLAGRGGGTLRTGRFLPDMKGNQGDLLGTLLKCAGVPRDRPIGIGTRTLTEIIRA